MHLNGTLSVQAVTEKDAGDYLCITRNKVADDYRLLRVSVTTKPAKIEPRQPLNHMVSLGKTLKVGSHICALLCVDYRAHIYIILFLGGLKLFEACSGCLLFDVFSKVLAAHSYVLFISKTASFTQKDNNDPSLQL